jgi:hypothetical protein
MQLSIVIPLYNEIESMLAIIIFDSLGSKESLRKRTERELTRVVRTERAEAQDFRRD